MLRRIQGLLAVVIVLAACARTVPQAERPPAAAAQPVPTVGGELIVRLAREPDNFNPILPFTAYGSAN